MYNNRYLPGNNRNVLEHNRQTLGELGNSIIGNIKSIMYQCLLHILQSLGQLHWRQRSTGSGKESESQPLTTEPEVRAELNLHIIQWRE